MTNDSIPPPYARFAQIMLGVVVFFFILYIAAELIIPLLYAFLVAVMLNPLVNWLSRKHVNRTLAISLALLLLVLVVGGIVVFFGSQATLFRSAMPVIKTKVVALLAVFNTWITAHLGTSSSQVQAWLSKSEGTGLSGGMKALGIVSNTVVVMLLVPVYAFLILYYKKLLLAFIRNVFNRDRHADVNAVLTRVKAIVQNYLLGLVIQVAIVSVLTTIALLLIGVPYAFLLGLVGGLLTVIPYLGGILAGGLMVLVALVTRSPTDALLVLAANVVIHFINNHYVVPRFVASLVRLNALVSIVVVLAGGALWGISGMFLAIPLTGILKAICDRIERLQPLGLLLGDDVPPDEHVDAAQVVPANTSVKSS